MALAKNELRRFGFGSTAAAGTTVTMWHLATNEAAAVVQAADYFNLFAAELKVGDIIFASVDLDGTPQLKNYLVTANTGTAVTVALQTTTA